MSRKMFFVVPLVASVLLFTSGCAHGQSGKTVHGTAEAFKKAEEGKSK